MLWSELRLILKTSSVTPDFFTFFIESYHFLPSVKVLKKSVCGKFCERVFTNPTRVSVIFASNTKYGTNTCEDKVTIFLDVTRILVVWEFSRVCRERLFCKLENKADETDKTESFIKFVRWVKCTVKSTVQFLGANVLKFHCHPSWLCPLHTLQAKNHSQNWG